MKTKTFKLEVKSVSEDGLFSGYASVFGNVDSDGEVIDKGAFKRTLDHTKGVVPILWQHKRDQPCGWNLTGEEDGYGLKVTGKLMLDTEAGRYACSFLKTGLEAGAKPGLSIGFNVPKNGDYVKDGSRHFREVALKEYSVVTFPANDQATASSVKEKDKMAVRHFKAEDFNSSLQEANALADMRENRWRMESALCDAIEDIQKDDALNLDQKKAAVRESLSQYAVAMGDWWAKYLDLTSDDPEEDNVDEKALRQSFLDGVITADQYNKARMVTQAGMAKVKEMMDTLDKSMGSHKAAMASHGEAYMQAKAARRLAQKIYANVDSNMPNPMPKSEDGNQPGDSEVLHSLKDALGTLAATLKG